MAAPELWQVEIDFKLNRHKEAEAQTQAMLTRIKEGEKRLTAAIMAEEKRTTAAKLSEIRTREAVVKSTLAKELTENKTKNTKELIDYKQMYAEKNRIARESAAQLKAQQKSDSKFTGQSTTLGSLDGVNQQLKYFTGLRNAASTNSVEFARYNSKVNELNASKRNLIGTTGSLTASLTGAVAGYLGFSMLLQKTTQFTKESIQGFAEDELAVNKLRLGLERLGEGDYLGKLIQQQTLLQSTTFFSDTQIGNAQAMLTSFKLSGKEIEILTPRLLDMATQLEQTGQGTADLQQLAIQLGKATGGELTGGLKRYGVVMTATQEEQLKLATGLERTTLVAQILDENFSGLAQNMQNTTAFQINYMTKALGELKEGFGAGLVGNMDSTGKSAVELAADLETIKTTGTALAKIMSGRWVLDFEKWQKSMQTGIGNTLMSWVGLKSEMESPITPSVSLELVNNAIDTIQNRFRNLEFIGTAKEHEAQGAPRYNPTKKSPGSKNSGSSKEKTLNFLEQFQKQIQDLETDITSLNSLMGTAGIKEYEKLQLQDQLIAKQKELNELKRIGLTLGSPMSLDGLLAQEVDLPGMIMKRNIKLNSSYAGDPRKDMTGADFEAMLQAELEKNSIQLSYATQIEEKFLNMLTTTGLIDNEFLNIINTLKSVTSDGIGVAEGIIGFFTNPIGTAVGAVGGLGGGQSLPNYTMPQQNPLVAPVIIKNPITLRQGLQIENRIDAVRGNIDI